MQCKANAKQTGEQCKRHAASGREVCSIHGGKSTGPNEPNVATNAVTHGAFADLAAEQIQDSAFGAISSEPDLDVEMRIARYKLYRLLDSSVIQNIVAGFNVEQIEADEFTKITGITALISEIRKLSKEMQAGGQDDPLAKLVRDWEQGMRSEGTLGDHSNSTPEHTP